MVNSQNIVDVTYKEVMQLWRLNKECAVQRLTVIRKNLGKKRVHKLTVFQYCKAEDISIEEFYNMLKTKN